LAITDENGVTTLDRSDLDRLLMKVLDALGQRRVIESVTARIMGAPDGPCYFMPYRNIIGIMSRDLARYYNMIDFDITRLQGLFTDVDLAHITVSVQEDVYRDTSSTCDESINGDVYRRIFIKDLADKGLSPSAQRRLNDLTTCEFSSLVDAVERWLASGSTDYSTLFVQQFTH